MDSNKDECNQCGWTVCDCIQAPPTDVVEAAKRLQKEHDTYYMLQSDIEKVCNWVLSQK